jgi:CrcB protein
MPDPIRQADPTGEPQPAGRHGRDHFRRGWTGADDPLPIDPDLSPEDLGEPSATHRPGPRDRSRTHPGVLAAVAVGGFFGTLARYSVGLAWPTHSGHFPTATFLINTSGAFLLGAVLTYLLEHRPVFPGLAYARPFVATGVLGGWTTYSTLVVGTDTLGRAGDLGTAATYLAATLVGGVVATTVGIALGRLVVVPLEPEGAS